MRLRAVDRSILLNLPKLYRHAHKHKRRALQKKIGKRSSLFPCHAWNITKKVGLGFPAPCAAIDSAKEDL